MKQLFALLTLVVFVAFGCNSPNSTPTGSRVNDINNPSANDGANSVTDIPTPSFTGATQSTGTSSGHMVCLDWSSNTPGYASGYSSYSTTPTDDNNFGHGSEYWGNTQNSMTGPGTGGHENQPYSGHYELSWTGPTSGNLDITADSYCVDNLPDGTYTFYLKAKSLEGVQPNAMTHHSATSSGYTVVIESCTEVAIADIYPIVPVSGGNGNWNVAGTTWTTNSSTTNQNKNIIFNVNRYTRTQNSCTNAITSTLAGAYTGDLYLTMDGGTIWRKSLAWSLSSFFQSNSNGPTGGNGSGFGKPGVGTYTVIYSTTASMAGQLGSFTMVVTP